MGSTSRGSKVQAVSAGDARAHHRRKDPVHCASCVPAQRAGPPSSVQPSSCNKTSYDHSWMAQVRLITAFHFGGSTHIVMDYVGQPLTSAGELPSVSLVTLQCSRGLGHLHHHGFVHRDVKPDNLAINEDGFVRLLDFGQAALFGHGLREYMGTRGFQSPEPWFLLVRVCLRLFACLLVCLVV
ncbi:CDKD-2 [Symbiodinium sp. CCMP2592]|nr:CDKD-2 [Symbiodinium sp. CCMP2592]